MNWWENVNSLSKNKKPYRSIIKEKNTIITSLDGKWNFKWFENVELLDHENPLQNFKNINLWKKISVPAVWELNGYGKPQYENSHHHVPHIPPKIISDNPAGLYDLDFSYKKKNKNNIVSLRMHGLDTIAKIWINNKFVGINKHARVTGEFDITKFLKVGNNNIKIMVVKYSDQTYLEDQDMWRFGGVFRTIELIEEPEEHIYDILTMCEYNKDESLFKIKFISKAKIDIKVSLFDNNKNIFTKNTNSLIELKTKLKNITPWSSENPKLYKLIIKSENQTFEMNVGFKKVEVIKNVMHINGVPIKIRGVNMHDFSSKNGKVISYEETKKHLQIIKKYNINAIRTSHYPKNYWFYELCDQMGFWVMDEADIEVHGAEYAGNWGDLANRPEYFKHFLEKTKQMVLRDRNYVSIFSFSMGNEAGIGPAFKQPSEFIRKNSTNALVHYEGDFMCEYVDMSSNMYTWIEDTHAEIKNKKEIERTFQNIQKGKRYDVNIPKLKEFPHIECEYAHAMGNGPGALKNYWDIFYSNDSFMGGFIWEWFDHGLKIKNKNDYQYGSDFGHKKHDKNFCIDGLIMPDMNPSPGLIETGAVYSPIHISFIDKSSFSLMNKYNFLDGSHLKLLITYKNYDGDILFQEKHSVKAMKRNEKSNYKILNKSADLVIVQVIDKYNVLITKSMIIKELKKPKIVNNINSFKIQELASYIKISSKNKIFELSKHDGNLIIKDKNNKVLIEGGAFNFWRPTIDNDTNLLPLWINKYHLNVTFNKISNISIKKLKNSTKLSFLIRTSCPTQGWLYETKFNYIFTKNRLDINLKSQRKLSVLPLKKPIFIDGMQIQKYQNDIIPFTLPRIGLEYKLPNDFKKVTYIGKGPNENYLDSNEASYIDVFKTNIKKIWTNYVVPQENGNHMDVSYFATENKDNKIAFYSNKKFEFNYYPYSIDNIDNAKHPSEIVKDKHNHLIINIANGPIHSNICGPLPLKKHFVSPKKFSLDFTIIC